MKIITILFTLLLLGIMAFGQAQHDAFLKDKELEQSMLKYDFKSFIDEPVLFISDTTERNLTSNELTAYLNFYLPKVKGASIKKASETNNGFIQTYGLYKQDDALYYIVLKLNPLSSKLEELVVDKNN